MNSKLPIQKIGNLPPHKKFILKNPPPAGHYSFVYTPSFAGSTWTTSFAFNTNSSSTHTFIIDNITMCPINAGPQVLSYNADMLMHTDYYPFGQQMPARTWQGTSEGYRYSHNSHEKEDAIYKGAQSAEYWMYDSRIGRRWEMDPVVEFSESPYATFANNPLYYSDPLGDRVKFGSFKNFLKVAGQWLSSKQFRQDWRKNVLDKYGMGGKNKDDLHLKVDKKSGTTLAEAVHKGEMDPGAAKKGGEDYLVYNGNVESKNVEIETEYKTTVRVDIPEGASDPNKSLDNTYRVNTKISDLKWNWKTNPNNPMDDGIYASGLNFFDKDGTKYFNISLSVGKKPSFIGQTTLPNGQAMPGIYSNGGGHIEYRISAMSIRQVYRVERGFFGTWNYKNRVLTNLKEGDDYKLFRGKLDVDLYKTNKYKLSGE